MTTTKTDEHRKSEIKTFLVVLLFCITSWKVALSKQALFLYIPATKREKFAYWDHWCIYRKRTSIGC